MIYLVLILLGLCFGSFINALVWRIHKQAEAKGKKAKAKYSISKGRSMCTHCGHVLGVADLIPVISWVTLRGRCRYCRKSINDSPIVELLLPVLFVLSYIFWPNQISGLEQLIFGLWLIFTTGFVALMVYDLKWYLLPNKIIFPLLSIAVIQIIIQLITKPDMSFFFNEISAIAIGGGIFWFIFQISKGKWIGGGDVKLGFLLGVLIGNPAQSLLMIFLASLLGTIITIPLLVTGKAKRNTHIPFGPFLITATFIVRLFGAGMVAWYMRQIGIQ